ncbi:MAG: hypothetical protein EA353_14100 [Puniceicoccaceae bacterium]|nr:MAG: hypothetical protein EA353_14100 [Puniceicoccaceae bacterium]
MHAVVTLVEGNFLSGAAALYNSLVANQFGGIFVVGHRGRDTLPKPILDSMESLPAHLPRIEFVQAETPWHFTNYKAAFIRRIFDDHPELDAISYLDPDIVVCGPWAWLASWCRHGPAVAGDVNWRIGPNHPTRYEWKALLRTVNLEPHHCPETYINGGMVSVLREDLPFIALWQRLIEELGEGDNPLDGVGDITAWRQGGRWNPMHTPDQDALNLAAMAWEGSLSVLGPDVMGFAQGGPPLLAHAVGPNKPWERRHLSEALRGQPPRFVDKAYEEHAISPISLHSTASHRRRTLVLKAAALIGRFYRRS